MESTLAELVSHLSDDRDEVCKAAVDIVEGLTGSEDGLQLFSQKYSTVAEALLKNALRGKPYSRQCWASLVNLASRDKQAVDTIIEHHAVPSIVSYVLQNSFKEQDVQLSLMLLTNLTASKTGARSIFDPPTSSNMQSILNSFFSLRQLEEGGLQCDRLEYVAWCLLANLSQILEGRTYLCKELGVLNDVALQLSAASEVRRKGCAATLRNMALKSEEEGYIAQLVPVTSLVLEALCGKDGLKEQVIVVRRTLADTVLILSNFEESRKALREMDALETLRLGYELEDDPEVLDAMERSAELLLMH